VERACGDGFSRQYHAGHATRERLLEEWGDTMIKR
jgi:hypothetical protein